MPRPTIATRWAISTLLALVGFVAANSACHSESKVKMKSEERASKVDHDLQALKSHLAVPDSAREVSFEIVPRGQSPGGLGPTDYLLVAVFRLDPGPAEGLARAAQPRPGSPPHISALANRPWFPVPVRAAVQNVDGNSVSVRGRKFDAGPLLKGAYATGYFVLVDGTDYVIVSAQTN